MDEIVLNEKNFDSEVEKNEPILVDFWATWCGPCRMVAPILEEIADENIIRVGKVNVDDEMALAKRFGIMSIPTMILFKDGKEINKTIGFIGKDELINFINSNK